jgi:hypothetical protein
MAGVSASPVDVPVALCGLDVRGFRAAACSEPVGGRPPAVPVHSPEQLEALAQRLGVPSDEELLVLGRHAQRDRDHGAGQIW